MSRAFDFSSIRPLQEQLNQHPVYNALRSRRDLAEFMRHHVYSVWDFMSLIKYLQQRVAPASYPWIPQGDGNVRRFINELVLEEESDQAGPEGADAGFASHFELYCQAMQEIGGSAQDMLAFLRVVQEQGIEAGLALPTVPEPARRFTRTSFAFLDADRPHCVAAALALGREHIIPAMFRAFLRDIGVSAEEAPTFHYYLNRHIHLDEDFHAPLSIRLLESLCEGDEQRLLEAEAAARDAIQARIAFWDGVLEALEPIRN